MNQSVNPWNILGQQTFNTELKENEIDPRAADNILLAWPPILQTINKMYPNSKGITALDFGCGTGGFCNKLAKLGFNVTGVDPSVGMIETAKKHSHPTIHYVLGDSSSLSSLGTFQIITSIMTLQFIENIQRTFQSIVNKLDTNGLFILAVFNPEWVKACLEVKISFADFDSNEYPTKGWKTFGDLRTRVYIRSSTEYNNVAKQVGLIKIMEEYPLFTPEFIKQYPDNRPKQISEYLILGYKKSKNRSIVSQP